MNVPLTQYRPLQLASIVLAFYVDSPVALMTMARTCGYDDSLRYTKGMVKGLQVLTCTNVTEICRFVTVAC
jgi:hypothetical protein